MGRGGSDCWLMSQRCFWKGQPSRHSMRSECVRAHMGEAEGLVHAPQQALLICSICQFTWYKFPTPERSWGTQPNVEYHSSQGGPAARIPLGSLWESASCQGYTCWSSSSLLSNELKSLRVRFPMPVPSILPSLCLYRHLGQRRVLFSALLGRCGWWQGHLGKSYGPWKEREDTQLCRQQPRIVIWADKGSMGISI